MSPQPARRDHRRAVIASPSISAPLTATPHQLSSNEMDIPTVLYSYLLGVVVYDARFSVSPRGHPVLGSRFSVLVGLQEAPMLRYTVIDAPSNLGLRPTGVETLPIAVKSASLIPRLGAVYGGRVAPLPYQHDRDPQTHVRNGEAIRTYSRHLADALTPLVQGRRFPIVLGGDCSILLGAMLALRRAGRCGLFFLDGHADFYQAEADLNGEVASMDLAIVSGRGPALLANIEGFRPLVRDEDSVVFGFRDAEAAAREGSQDVRTTAMHTYDLAQARAPDVDTAATQALANSRPR